MSKILVEDGSTFPGSVVVPEDGIDLRSALTVETPFQQLSNRTRFLQLRQADVITYQLQNQRLSYPVVHDEEADEWGMQSNYSNGTRWMIQALVNSSHPYFWIPLGKLPATWRINSVGVMLKGASVHAVDDPPLISLFRMWDGVSTIATSVPLTNNVDDPEDAAYDEWHLLNASASNYEIEEESTYAIRVRGEFNGGAVADLKCFGARLNLLVPSSWTYG